MKKSYSSISKVSKGSRWDEKERRRVYKGSIRVQIETKALFWYALLNVASLRVSYRPLSKHSPFLSCTKSLVHPLLFPHFSFPPLLNTPPCFPSTCHAPLLSSFLFLPSLSSSFFYLHRLYTFSCTAFSSHQADQMIPPDYLYINVS